MNFIHIQEENLMWSTNTRREIHFKKQKEKFNIKLYQARTQKKISGGS